MADDTYLFYGGTVASGTMTDLVVGLTGYDRIVTGGGFDNVDAATVPATATVTCRMDRGADTIAVGPRDFEVAVGDSVFPSAGIGVIVKPGYKFQAQASAANKISAHLGVQQIPHSDA